MHWYYLLDSNEYFWHGPFYTWSSRTSHTQHILCQMYIKLIILTHNVQFMTSPRWHFVKWAMSRRTSIFLLVIYGREHDAMLPLCQLTRYVLILNQHPSIACILGRRTILCNFHHACCSKATIKRTWRLVLESDKGSGEPLLHISHGWDMEASALQLL